MPRKHGKLFCRAALERLEERALLSAIFVDTSAPGVTEDGASWNTAYKTLTAAITAAVAGDEIRVADGTYKPTDTTDRTISFQLKNGVTIFGGYAGYGAVDPDERDTTAFETILSGDIGTAEIHTDNSYRVVIASLTDNATVLDGLTIRDGNATGNSGAGGNGLYIINASPVIRNCLFTNNRAVRSGSAIQNGSGSSAVIDNCRFVENVGISIPGVSVNNGAMHNASGSSPTVINSSFVRNIGEAGAAVSNLNANSTFVNCRFEGNSTQNFSHLGAAVYSVGAIAPSFTNCTFVGNRSGLRGGAVEIQNSAARFTNCAFIANSAPQSIIDLRSGASPVFTNCIVWGNTTAGSLVVTASGATVTFAQSDVQGGWAGAGNINADPLFTTNPEDGADNTWGTSDDDYGDLTLQAGSPCLDAGNNFALPFGTLTDLAGNPRFSDIAGVNDPGSMVDMGAYERQGVSTFTAAHSAFLYDTPQQAVRFGFNESVDPTTIASADVTVLNLTTNMPIDMNAAATTAYDGQTFSIKWNFASPLPDGNYRATLSAGTVSDADGNPLVAAATFEFFVFGGDANRDRVVDARDLVILSNNWYASGKVFTQGDFTYDGTVDAADLTILATNWNQRLDVPPPPAAPPATPTIARRVPVRTPVRTLALVTV